MSDFKTRWHLQTLDDQQKLNLATLQLHHAAQLVAMVGNSYLPKADDDSQSNMLWYTSKESLVGHWIGEEDEKHRLALNYPEFMLTWQNGNGNAIGALMLDKKTKTTAIDWMREYLESHFHLDPERLQPIRHFEIPDHPVASGSAFHLLDAELHQELAHLRSNAQHILEYFAHKFEHASPVRTWPHHFDSGAYIPVAFDDDGKAIKSIGIGLAIADDDLDEHYYYVNHWTKSGDIDYSSLPNLSSAGYWHTEGWTGAVMKHSTILTEEQPEMQANLVESFLCAGINASLKLIGEEAQLI